MLTRKNSLGNEAQAGKATMESGNPCNSPDTLLYTKLGNGNYNIAVKARPGISIGTCYPRNDYLKTCNQPLVSTPTSVVFILSATKEWW